jgi:hypothetical protein
MRLRGRESTFSMKLEGAAALGPAADSEETVHASLLIDFLLKLA